MKDNHLTSNCVVIIPVYKAVPSETEFYCFNNNCNILKKHPIIVVSPEDLDVSSYTKNKNILNETFPSSYFDGIDGYNQLMLSENFYERFRIFKYILICQLDVFIFKDELNYWCNKGYDYIGAPWVNRPFEIMKYITVKTGLKNALKLLFSRKINKCVGNGGLSLRRTQVFIDIIYNERDKIESWNANEDFYWSFFAKMHGKPLFVPNYKEASKFSIEVLPQKLMKLNNGILPMGIHAWERYDPLFWRPILKEYEFNL